MTLSQLEDQLERLRQGGYTDDTPITVCDLEDDSDESYHFKNVTDVDTVKTKKMNIIVLFFGAND